ncbi:diguanylate cyclase [Guyparkeria hydrothermalis]|uniref:sensor domain-containing diguanylate cyclase n=1 Tax=Guyparkeria hydrothermalis TaxID=923 RepID=UPI002020D4C2|nr:diguanylate cyclase [Guyparkeria hydrothermalis]MCL7744080.1 diguanylate cyclase [Guyparkeria hydrothermalis]
MNRPSSDSGEERGGVQGLPPYRRGWLVGGLLPLLTGLLVTAGLLASIGAVERQLATATLHADLDELAGIRTRIESQLNQASNVSDSIGALIEVNQGLDEARVIEVAERMLERTSVIRLIGVAPDNILRLIVPEEGNEAAIGLDLSGHPEQSASVRRAMESGESVLGGPYELVQGGYAAVHRVPIFFDVDGDGQKEYWGAVSTPIDLMAVMERAGAKQLLDEGRLAVRGYEGLGAVGDVFAGEAALFGGPEALTTPVIALDGEWQLAMRPTPMSGSMRGLFRVAELLAILFGLAVMWLAMRWQIQQRQLVRSERLLRDVTTSVSDAVFRTDAKGRLIFLSPAFDRMTGCDGSSRLGKSWLTLFADGEDQARVQEAVNWAALPERRTSRTRAVVTTRLSCGEASELPVELRVERVGSQRFAPAGLVGILTDLTDRQAFEQLEGLATAVFEGAGDAIAILDRHRKVLAVNPAFERLVGLPSAELVGHRLTTPEVVDNSRRRLESCMRNLRLHGRWTEEIECRLPDGRKRVLGWSVDLIRDDRRRINRYVCVINDVTVRHRRLEAMHYRALHDPLTKVLNRSGLEERFEQARQHAIREGRSIALAFVDLNGFKPINDSLGHHVGDEVLKEVAHRLTTVGRREDIVARLGGDEFVVAFYGVHSDADIRHLCQSLRARLSTPLTVSGVASPIGVRASVGVARFPEDAETLDGLMRSADAAMYRAKEATRGSGDTMVFRAGSGKAGF